MFLDSYENPRDGKIKHYCDFNKYYHDCSDNNMSKHGFLLQMVEEYEDVIDGFTSLKELCWTARYSRYAFSKEIANQCYRNLELIEEYCNEVGI